MNAATANDSGLREKEISTGRSVQAKHSEGHELLGSILDDSLNEILVFDAETLLFLRVNRGARENLGYSIQELDALTPVDIKPEHTAESFDVVIAPLRVGNEEKLVFETIHRRKDGSDYNVLVHLQLTTYNSRPAFVAISLDITERKETIEELACLNNQLEQRVEERTRQLQDAQENLVRKEKLATLGQLAGGVAHEIRNPLGVIRNAVYYLQKILSKDDEDANEALGEITRGLANSQRIVSELLDYARGPTADKSVFPLDEAIDSALEMVTIPKSISVARPDTSSLHIMADRGQIERLLANLIQNATQAMPDGGALTLRCMVDDVHVITEVSDTGVGIQSDEIEKIFEPLFTKWAKGFGLGLPLCRRYAEQNSGTLSAKSEAGKGSTFSLTLQVTTTQP